MNAAYVSAVVAGTAVIVSGLMQYLTLRHAKESARSTAAATERTARMTALSSATILWEQGLREDIAQFATQTYVVESAYKSAMERKAPWPGEYAEKVADVDTVFNRILLRLNDEVPSERNLIESLEAMRERDEELWSLRREKLVEAALAAFRARWTEHIDGRV